MLLGLGHILRMRFRILQTLYLPSCVIAGLLGLTLLAGASAAGHPLPPAWTAGWNKLPGILINVVFACLFLGVALPKLSELWKRAGLQLAYGQIVAWGQYVVGIGLVLFLLGPLFKLPALFAGILPVGFEGGHGTAGGMGPIFDQLGWAEGKDFALAAATGGILGAIIVGMGLVNWAARRGYTVQHMRPSEVAEDDSIGIIPLDRRPSAGNLTVHTDAVESFSLHLVIVAAAILIGYLLKVGLVALEARIPALAEHSLLSSFPLFPLCMLGGLAIQFCDDRYDRHKLIDLGLMRRIQNSALDFLVVAAIATIRVDVVLKGLAPLLILIFAGILWNVFCVLFLARRVFKDAWFERSIAEMGQSMGVTATGLLLLRVVDPDYKSPAADAFACKQLLHEPFMGGGLWTGMAIPLIAAYGGLPVLAISAGAVAAWLLIIFVPRTLRARSAA
jgi:ESS family glutamate:Na+ symporter